jgi:hypothetical protein
MDIKMNIQKILEIMDWVVIPVHHDENGREYWGNTPVQSKRGKYWKWGKVGFLYLKPYIFLNDNVFSYDPELIEPKSGVLFGVYQSCLSGTKISTAWGKCCVCGKKLVYGINAWKCKEEYAFAIADVRKEYYDQYGRELWFCKECFKEVVKEALKLESEGK